MKLLGHDSPIVEAVTLIVDVVLIGVLWCITSLLIVTIGASTSSAYYVIMRRITNREHHLFKDYFKAFKSSFKNSTLAFVFITLLFLLNAYSLYVTVVAGSLSTFMLGFHFIVAIEMIFIYIHVFPLAARFEMKFMELIKKSLLMAHKHLFTTLIHIVIIIIILLFTIQMPFFFLIAFGFYSWASSYIMLKMYRKYHPDMDKDPPEK